jgi:hypothetical protein
VVTLVRAAGYGREEPIVIGVRQPQTAPFFLAQGRTLTGEPLRATTLAYTASLSKQMTAGCAALIVALARFPALERRPGTRHVYSNAGYVCLAVVDLWLATAEVGLARETGPV